MRRNTLFATLAPVIFVTVFHANLSFGQSVLSGNVHSHRRHFHRHFRHLGWDGGYHASTAAEGYARGLADVIRARGEANLANALAQRQWEAAQQQSLENRVLKVETFYARRELFEKSHAEELAQRRKRTLAHLARLRLAELTSEELNPATGEISWPTLLADEAFADYSAWFDALLAERAKYGKLDAGTSGEAEALIKQWRAELTAVREQVPEAVLRDSLRFLLRLDRELRASVI